MKTVNKSVLIWYSAEEMYALVTDVEKYPQFLPWCDKARVIEEDEAGMTSTASGSLRPWASPATGPAGSSCT